VFLSSWEVSFSLPREREREREESALYEENVKVPRLILYERRGGVKKGFGTISGLP
jgi:hypothetical protein